MFEHSRNDSKERNTPKNRSEVTRKTKDFATGQGLPDGKVSSRDIGLPDGKVSSRDIGLPDGKVSSRDIGLPNYRKSLGGRLEWYFSSGSIPVYTPSSWEGSKPKKILVDRINAVWKEVKELHIERTERRLTGNIPNEELYRFFKDADLKPGTYIDLGAGGGNFIPHVLGKLIGWDHSDMKIYAVERNNDAFKILQDNVGKIAKKEPLSKGKIELLKEDYTKGGYLEKFKENHDIADVSGILWANNGHYYSSEKRVELMKQMKSILDDGENDEKNDGKLLIVDYNTFKQHEGFDKDGKLVCYNEHPLSKKQLKIELELAGFENVKFLQELPSSDQYMMYSAIATVPKRSEAKDVS